MVDGVEMEPVEDALIDIPDEYVGAVSQEMGVRRGEMVTWSQTTKGTQT